MSDREELRAARTAQLAAAAAARAENTRADVRRALIKLRAKGEAIDLSTVARTAGCSVSYLRKHPDLFAEIRTLTRESRARTDARRGTPETSSLASLRTKLAVATERLKELDEENARLRAENAALRGEVLDLRRKARRGRSETSQP